jgi:hypothetical protein
VCYAVTTGLWLTVALWLACMVSLRRVVRWAFAQPPEAPGRPPRCRCCGAELAPAGAVRRCGFCDADHIVTGERYRARQAALEETLGDLERQLDTTLAARNRRVERMFGVAGCLPLLLCFTAPLVSLAVTHTEPDAWVFPLVLCGLSLLLAAWAHRWRPVEVPSLGTLQAGDTVHLRGAPLRVLAVASLRGMRRPLHLVGEGDAPIAAFEVEVDDEGETQARAFELRPGGEPISSAEVARAELFELRRGRSLGRLPESPWGVADLRQGTLDGLRVFEGQPGAGQEPAWTATRADALAEADLTAIPTGPAPA